MTDVPSDQPPDNPAFLPPIPPGEDLPGSIGPGDKDLDEDDFDEDDDEPDGEDVYPELPDGGIAVQ